MGALAPALGVLSKVATIAGTVISFGASISQGKQTREIKEYEAAQLDVQAKNEYAIGAKRAQEIRRQNQLQQSRARAVGAAFGGGVDADIIGDLAAAGELDALTALWEGREAATGRNAQAAVSRAEGRQLERAGKLKGITTILSSGSSLYEKYKRDQ